jgi:hypothetical protein
MQEREKKLQKYAGGASSVGSMPILSERKATRPGSSRGADGIQVPSVPTVSPDQHGAESEARARVVPEPDIEIFYPGSFPKVEEFIRRHWSAYTRERKRIARELAALIGSRVPSEPFPRARFEFHRFGRRLMDECNLESMTKIPLDVLQPFHEKLRPSGIGVIAGDDPTRLVRVVSQEHARKNPVGIRIRITRIA